MNIDVQWPLVLFTMLVGIGGGVLVPVGVSEVASSDNDGIRFKAIIASLVLLAVGGCASVMHLASPENVMAAVGNLASLSGISVELILLGATFLIALTYAVCVKRSASTNVRKVVAVVCCFAALLLLFFCGHGYVMVARPAWNTNLLPLAYLGTALAAGAFAYECIRLTDKRPTMVARSTRAYVLLACLISAASCLAYAAYTGVDAGSSAPLVFWGGIIVCGVILCLAAGIACYLQVLHGAAAIVVAGLVVTMLAALSVRVFMWEVGSGYLNLFDLARAGAYLVP